MKIIFTLLALLISVIHSTKSIGKCKGIIDMNWANQCVLDEGGFAHCFASYLDDKWGIAKTTPKDIAFTEISLQRFQVCGIVAEDQSLKCWGKNEKGILNPKAGKYIDMCVNLNYGCALQEDGYIYCWGKSSGKVHSAYPKDGGYKAVSCGYLGACAVKNDGELVCWGITGDKNYKAVIDKVGYPEGIKVKDVSILSYNGVGIKDDDTMVMWGWDSYGVFDGMPTDVKVDTAVATIGGGVAIKSEDKTFVCWGSDKFNHVTDCPKGKFYTVGCSADSCCGVRPDKEIVCWGRIENKDGNEVQEMLDSGVKPKDCGGSKSTCEDTLMELEAEVSELQAEVELWKARFEAVENLEVNDRHSVQAMAQYPDPENEVGSNLVSADSFASLFKFTMFLGVFGGVFGLGKMLGQKSSKTAVYTEMSQMQ